MTTYLIICEKKDVGVSVAQAITPNHTVKDGYIVSSDGKFLITWAIGHLLTMKEPGEINSEWLEWKWETLPMIPDKIQLKVIGAREQKQLKIIRELEKKVDIIVNACDAGIEGENIFSFISLYLGFKKPTYRLWSSSLQTNAIQKAFKNMKPSTAYIGLRNAGFSRAIGDWIIGLNASRALSLAASNNGEFITLNTGRIMAPTLALIYDRHMERENFVKTKYYPILGIFKQGNIQYKGYWVGERLLDKEATKKIVDAIKGKTGIITDIEEKKKQLLPPILMNLTDVTKIANARFDYTGTKTLEILQSLYLKKYITYPRTNSRHVTPAEIALMHRSFDVLKEAFPNLSEHANKSYVTEKNTRICNIQKVTDHHAILPEPVVPSNLSSEEQNIYSIILERFFAQFHHPLQYIQKSITTIIGDHTFKSNYKQLLDLGWKRILKVEEDDENKDEIEGDTKVERGEVLCADTEIEEKETVPPPNYNDGTLIDMMEDISKKIDDPALKLQLKECGIGTSATRAQIIKKLVDYGYVVYNKKSLMITKKGIALIELLRKTKINLLTSPELTAQWEKELEAIRNGKSNQAFMNSIRKFAELIIDEAKKLVINPSDFQQYYGNCPKCNNGIIQSEKRYYCSNYKNGCDFYIWKNQYNKNITVKMLEQLLKKGKTGKLTFTSKKDTKYKAYLELPQNINNGKLSIIYVDK